MLSFGRSGKKNKEKKKKAPVTHAIEISVNLRLDF